MSLELVANGPAVSTLWNRPVLFPSCFPAACPGEGWGVLEDVVSVGRVTAKPSHCPRGSLDWHQLGPAWGFLENPRSGAVFLSQGLRSFSVFPAVQDHGPCFFFFFPSSSHQLHLLHIPQYPTAVGFQCMEVWVFLADDEVWDNLP